MIKAFSVPAAIRPAFDAVVDRIDALATAQLTEEYLPVLHEAAAALARKRPSPLLRGDPASWACGIVHAIGSVNFLFDKTQTPHMTAVQIAQAFGVSASTGAAKAAIIRKALKMAPHDPRWCVASMLAQNPLVWMLEVNGFIIDIRQAPLDLQRAAFERFDIIVHDNESDESKSVSVMSGGERVWINECLTRAIALYLARHSGRRYATLFSDEADGSLDAERKRMFMEMKRAVLRREATIRSSLCRRHLS